MSDSETAFVLDANNHQTVREKVASGMYSSANEVVREALRLLDQKERARSSQLDRGANDVAIGVEQANRGETIVLDENLVEEIREKAARRFRTLRGR